MAGSVPVLHESSGCTTRGTDAFTATVIESPRATIEGALADGLAVAASGVGAAALEDAELEGVGEVPDCAAAGDDGEGSGLSVEEPQPANATITSALTAAAAQRPTLMPLVLLLT
jgi:hypothetical protein